MDNKAPNYQVLARRYRPQTFSDLVGQPVLVQTLSHAIKMGRVAHAFIFTGVRGVGKTTTARLLAKALNCTGKAEGSVDPCGFCEQCVAISEDRHVDIIEVDAASRTGVDDMRDLMDGLHYQPAFGQYKVYIIDEVHMLSKSAFNALLKTLEEPPAHVKFIFATTEIHKVPVTVLSRCQRFDLACIDAQTLFPYFEKILKEEKITFEPDALRLICHAAQGSARDGKSLLEQAILGAQGQGDAGAPHITMAFVQEMLGVGDMSQSLILLDHLLRGKPREAIDLARAMVKGGAAADKVLQDLLSLVHALSLLRVVQDKAESFPDLSQEVFEACKALSQDASVSTLSLFWQVLLKGAGDLVQSPLSPLQALEMVLVRLMHTQSLVGAGGSGGGKPLDPKPDAGAETAGSAASVASSRTQALSVPDAPMAGPAQAAAAPIPEAPVADMVSPNTQDSGNGPGQNPQTYSDLVALFVENREPLLADMLRRSWSVQHFSPGSLDVYPLHDQARTIVRDVLSKLKTWTGQTWDVRLTDTPGGEVLAETERALVQAALDEAKQRADVQAVLRVFPDAKITLGSEGSPSKGH